MPQCEEVNCNWYLFYCYQKNIETQTMRFAASCLGNALTTAKELASRCGFYLIGVAPDIGVADSSLTG